MTIKFKVEVDLDDLAEYGVARNTDKAFHEAIERAVEDAIVRMGVVADMEPEQREFFRNEGVTGAITVRVDRRGTTRRVGTWTIV